jgi:hypothetical protein
LNVPQHVSSEDLASLETVQDFRILRNALVLAVDEKQSIGEIGRGDGGLSYTLNHVWLFLFKVEFRGRGGAGLVLLSCGGLDGIADRVMGCWGQCDRARG